MKLGPLEIKLELNSFRELNTSINTRTQEEYNTLMRIYEIAGWTLVSREPPTSSPSNRWKHYEGETCIEAKNCLIAKSSKWKCKEHGCTILTSDEFYKVNRISKNVLNTINEYFEKYGKIEKMP